MSALIAFEGPEGGGKSLQIVKLADALSAAGYRVLVTREPGGTIIGDRIRSLFLGSEDLGLFPETEVLMLAAARAQHVRQVLRPALEQGTIVLCDRYVDSTYAYQGAGLGIDVTALDPIQQFATDGLVPDIRVLLDVSSELGLSRRQAESETVNRIDLKDLAFHERVRSAFNQRANLDPEGWLVIDASDGIDEVATAIRVAVLAHLATRTSDR